VSLGYFPGGWLNAERPYREETSLPMHTMIGDGDVTKIANLFNWAVKV